MNITAYIETHRFDLSIQNSPEHPTQYNLVRCSYVEINIGILIRLHRNIKMAAVATLLVVRKVRDGRTD